ncbi:MAG: asparagine synthase (glutamine-hydrolyzing) [Magnetococcales bacterium]|nr:asparagine synthase (glutamine-hydrolyzing) [Magnetococcales bacterium]
MCGIAGWFGPAPQRDRSPKQTLRAMISQIAHRGPDGQGIHLENQVGLGHVRLAIIDPNAGAQPLWDYHRRGVIIYNGETYNFPEFRTALSQRGTPFQTRTDTETVLVQYLEYGLDGLAHLSGMFAFAIWDPHSETGILVRDRQGIKPLFIRQEGERLLFASEAKALLPAMNQSARMDTASLHLLLNFRYVPGEDTLFQGVHQLAPGGVLIWQNGRISQTHLSPFPDRFKSGSPDEEEIRSEIVSAVERHMIADVPVGIYLSAGLDSATIASVASELNRDGSPPQTFTIEAGDHPDEADGAQQTARQFGLSNLREPMPGGFDRWLPRLVWHLETPKVNAYQAASVAQLASRHCKVALSGLGGDELFLGYVIHRFLQIQTRVKRWPGATPLLRTVAHASAQFLPQIPPLRWEERVRGIRMVGSLGTPRAYGIIRNVWDHPHQRQRLYGPRLLDANLPDAFHWLGGHWPDSGGDYLTQGRRFEEDNKLVNDFLWQEDRVSMAFGLESRTPFLDEALIQLVNRLTWQELMPGGRLKGLMRRVVRPWLGDEILSRPKSGFQVNAADFFSTHLRPFALEWLSPQRLKDDGLFNPVFVDKILHSQPDNRLRWHYFLLYLMVGTSLWVELFEKNGDVPSW